MIRYIGGKTRLARKIFNKIKEYVKEQNFSSYKEPFFGGGSMSQFSAALNISRFCSDNKEDLILFYKELQKGWLPPKEISEDLYSSLKNEKPSPLRGYAGFACSFGGKWFGGYARDKTKRRNLINESYVRVVKSLPYIKDIYFKCSDYLSIPIEQGTLVYCDPPYKGVLGYGGKFNHDLFWETCRTWSKRGAAVFVSEYEAPKDMVTIAEWSYKTYIHHAATKNYKVERLFTPNVTF